MFIVSGVLRGSATQRLDGRKLEPGFGRRHSESEVSIKFDVVR